MVAVVGVSASSQANLLAEIDALGTNLLTVTPGTDVPRATTRSCPTSSVPMIGHMRYVDSDVAVYQVSGATVLPQPVRARRRRPAGSASTPPATNLPAGAWARRWPPATSSTP